MISISSSPRSRRLTANASACTFKMCCFISSGSVMPMQYSYPPLRNSRVRPKTVISQSSKIRILALATLNGVGKGMSVRVSTVGLTRQNSLSSKIEHRSTLALSIGNRALSTQNLRTGFADPPDCADWPGVLGYTTPENIWVRVA